MLLIAVLWMGVHYTGALGSLEQWGLNLRFRLRGPMVSEAKVYYVNRDAAASRQFGKVWFPREYFAMAGEALLDLGGARAILFDFVLTSDHLPRNEAPALTYPGNLAMQRFLLTHPHQVVLGAAFSGKRYPFSKYSSVLPDRRDGPWRLESGKPLGYDPIENPLPDLPEFPLWCPPIDIPDFPFPGIAQVGLINTSTSLNHGQQVQWVPAMVEVRNELTGLFLINGIQRWQNTVAWESGRDGRYAASRDDERSLFLVSDEEGKVVSGVPQLSDELFLTAALRLFETGYPGAHWELLAEALVLRDGDDTVIRTVPLRAGQHLAVNWYSPWHVGSPELQEAVEVYAGQEMASGQVSWDVPQIGKHPTEWIDAVEQGDPLAIDPIRLWGLENDPYNPKVSIADVLFFYEAYQIAKESGAVRTPELIREIFQQFEDAFILVGPTDPMLQDLAPTPFDKNPVPKVAVHGNLLKMLVDGRFLREAGGWQLPFWVVFLTFSVGYCVTTDRRRAWLFRLFAGGLVLGFILCVQVAFVLNQWVIPLIAPLGASTSSAVVGVGWRLWEEKRQKARIRHLFGTYVSPDVVDLMVDSAEEPQLGGHVREVTAFFSDIEAFSSIGEQLGPELLVELMNEYLGTMTSVLKSERGTLDKYIGDAIVGIFGAPFHFSDHAARACEAALQIQSEQKRLCRVWQQSGRDWPDRVKTMRTRIGLHSGDAVVGNMGSKHRFTYTMMGDSVNLASRLEQLGKTYGVDLIVSDTTRVLALKRSPHLVFRFLDIVAVKGRKEAVRVYELFGRGEAITGDNLECIAYYEAGLEAYLAGDWNRAKPIFLRALEKEKRVHEPINPSKLMIDRCQFYVEGPPDDDWNGVHVMDRK